MIDAEDLKIKVKTKAHENNLEPCGSGKNIKIVVGNEINKVI